MVIIKCNAHLPHEQYMQLAEDFAKQVEVDCLVLPVFCELLESFAEDDPAQPALILKIPEEKETTYTCPCCGSVITLEGTI